MKIFVRHTIVAKGNNFLGFASSVPAYSARRAPNWYTPTLPPLYVYYIIVKIVVLIKVNSLKQIHVERTFHRSSRLACGRSTVSDVSASISVFFCSSNEKSYISKVHWSIQTYG